MTKPEWVAVGVSAASLLVSLFAFWEASSAVAVRVVEAPPEPKPVPKDLGTTSAVAVAAPSYSAPSVQAVQPAQQRPPKRKKSMLWT